MAGGGTSTPGNWGGGGARSSSSRSKVGSVGRGFAGTRGFTDRLKSASGRALQGSQTSNIPYRGEEDLYSMVGRLIGGGMTPLSATMDAGPGGNYNPPGAGGMGSEFQGYGTADPFSGMGIFGGPSGSGDLGQQGYGTEPGYGYGGFADVHGKVSWEGFDDVGIGGSRIGDPIDPGGPGSGQSGLGEGYMQEDYSPFTPGSISRPPSRLPITGGASYPPGKFPSKRLPISAYLSPPGSKPWNPYEHGPPAGAGYDPLGEGDWADIMGNPFAGEFGPQDFYPDMPTNPMLQEGRKESICLPGDPNCR